MSLELWLGFALASTIAVAIPGPVVIFVLGRAATGGWRSALPIWRPRVRTWFNRAGGTALIGAGLATAAIRRA
ncbi:MAG: hypothetical protein H7345_14205 [Rubritepida sp.]|nr:hypothetical protein [Rubritepida sp.]